MPEPNLPPLRLSFDENDENVVRINVPALKKLMPELPFCKRKIFMEKSNLPQDLVLRLLVSPVFCGSINTYFIQRNIRFMLYSYAQHTQKLVDYFLHITDNHPDVSYEKLAHFLLNDVIAAANRAKIRMEDWLVSTN